MADYSPYLPQTAGLESFVGLSPEKLAQIREYATPDNVGRIHPMGGMAMQGEARRQSQLGEYLNMLAQGNEARREMFHEAGGLNLREAAINQGGRLGAAAINSGRVSDLAGGDLQGLLMPGMLDQNGQINPQFLQEDQRQQVNNRMKGQQALGAGALNAANAGLYVDSHSFANEWGLPVTRGATPAEKVAAIRASAAGGKSKGPTVSKRFFSGDTLTTINGPASSEQQKQLYGSDTSGPAAAGAANTEQPGAQQPVEVDPASLTPKQRAILESYKQEADQAGVQLIGVFDYGDGVPQAVVEQNGQQQAAPLDDGTSEN